MTEEREAIERLERRLDQLEAIVRKLLSPGELARQEEPRSRVEPLESPWQREPRAAARAEVAPDTPVEQDAHGQQPPLADPLLEVVDVPRVGVLTDGGGGGDSVCGGVRRRRPGRTDTRRR